MLFPILCHSIQTYINVVISREISIYLYLLIHNTTQITNNDISIEHMRIFCSFPNGQISALQRRQMTTVDDDSVNVFAYEG